MTPPPIEDELSRAIREHRDRYPRAVRAIQRLIALAPMLRRAAKDMLLAYGETFLRRAEARVAEIDYLCAGDPQRFDEAVRAYVRFCLEFARKQAEFLRTGKYAFQDFDAMCAELYDNAEAVQDFYLLALLFSFVFSPNYYEFYDFFEGEFLPHVPPAAQVCEIGCGHGVYLGQTLLARERARGLGIDISEAALDVARRMLAFYGVADARIELVRDDLRGQIARPDGCADALICCEVLEHLPDPQHALCELRRLLATDGVLMLSAAIRMESVDHLHVFRTAEEVVDMAEQARLRIVAQRVVPLAKGNLRDPDERRRLAADPRVPVGFICRAQRA